MGEFGWTEFANVPLADAFSICEFGRFIIGPESLLVW